MIKTYKANTNVSINVVLPSKKNLHISFVPLSNGSSTFTTDNEDIMNAIESHYNFGKLFRLHSQQGESIELAEHPIKEEQTVDVNSTSANEAEPTLEEVTVSDLAAAKDYLADRFGISRTALRSKQAIEEQAAAHGVEMRVES